MAITLVQHAQSKTTFSSGSSGTASATFGSGPTAGNCLIACFTVQAIAVNGTPSVSSVETGSSTDNWTLPSDASVTISDESLGAIYVDPGTGASSSTINVAVAFGGTASSNDTVNVFIDIYEVSGLASSSVADQASANSAPNTESFTSDATATTTAAAEFWVGVAGAMADSEGQTVGFTGPSSPWTNEAAQTSSITDAGSDILDTAQISGYQITTSTGAATYSGTMSHDSDYVAVVVTLKAATGSPDVPQIQPGATWLAMFKPGQGRQAVQLPPSGPNPANLPNPADVPQIQPGTGWLNLFKQRDLPQSPPSGPYYGNQPDLGPDQPAIQPGPAWLAYFKPGRNRPQISAPPSGPNPANLPNLSDQPAIQPGPTWLAQFKPGLVKPRAFSPDPGPVYALLSAATVTIAAPQPTVSGVGITLPVATVTVAGYVPAIGIGPKVATVTIGTPQPTVSGVGVGLPVATVTIGTPSVMVLNPSDMPAIQPGPAWWHHFKGFRPTAPQPPYTKTVYLPTAAAVTISAPTAGITTAPALATGTVTIAAYPVKVYRQLVVSIASQSGTDDYGNTFPQGIQVGSPSSEATVIVVPGPTGYATGVGFQLPNVSLSNIPNVASATAGGTPYMDVSGPAVSTSGNEDWVQLTLWANNGIGGTASMEFNYINSSGDASTTASYTEGGWTFDSDVTFSEPVTVTDGITANEVTIASGGNMTVNGSPVFGWSGTGEYPAGTGNSTFGGGAGCSLSTGDFNATAITDLENLQSIANGAANLANYIYAVLVDANIIS